MLDTMKLAAQMGAVAEHLQNEAIASQNRLQRVLEVYAAACANPQPWISRQDSDPKHLWFNPAIPMEDLSTKISIQPLETGHVAIATDGSQITPNHHEVAYCSLVNVGRIAIDYSGQRLPLLDSTPQVFYRSEDLNHGRPAGVGVETILALRRTQAEMEELTALALDWHRKSCPAIALADGALIHWGLDSLPSDYHQQWMDPLLKCYDQLRKKRIPIVGYISSSRSGEMMNFLRLGLCPFETCECNVHCSEGTLRNAPCTPDKTKQAKSKTKGLARSLGDAVLWSQLLEPGQRSPLWRSQVKLLETYGRHRVYFCYLNVGQEIARVEFPEWVAQDNDLLRLALEGVLMQVRRGMGYPVVLAEAHHLAVVRGGDRQRFFALLQREMERVGLPGRTVSLKEASKRAGFA
ncbi:MAG: DNA double-strand break repair nuclease NurA [Cyanobacteria bacterium J06597_1]